MKIKVSLRIFLAALILPAFIISCTKERDEIPSVVDCNAVNAKYSTDISTVVQSNCAINSGCHGSGSVNGPGPLTSYNQVSAAAAIIKDAVVSRRMPLGGTLGSTDINKIKCWVDSGAPNN